MIGKAENRQAALLVVKQACKAIFRPAAGFAMETVDISVFSAAGTKV